MIKVSNNKARVQFANTDLAKHSKKCLKPLVQSP